MRIIFKQLAIVLADLPLASYQRGKAVATLVSKRWRMSTTDGFTSDSTKRKNIPSMLPVSLPRSDPVLAKCFSTTFLSSSVEDFFLVLRSRST